MKMNRLATALLMLLFVSVCPAQAQGTPASDAYSTNRGFRHPGGLHTQEDFDRVKAQLAAGNTKVVQAYNVLKNAAYAQPTATSSPVATIVRGGGSGENYINAARGATMAYQNALRWKIEGNTACADNAVRILMAWANTTKNITGNSDQCLAVGLYGYEFAQAAELMRDYEGWTPTNFEKFKRWMLDLWYPKAIGFLRYRNGTWENSGKWWQAPGHYWSNWGLCNALCVISIGILCDDVFIYNQGMSYFKYDQVGTFRHPRTDNPIKNDGLTEFLGNLVVTVADSELETGAYGQLGQMNESGRDTGHSAMALGLAIDIAKVGWNQGDDLFAYMNHRLAAGIEYVAAQTQSVQNLPWTNYHYASSGYYYSDSRAWLMTEPALGAQMRPYWGTVIGIYEGVKGVAMPFSEQSYEQMGIDAGGQGSTSGGYDHLGYSVLMNTRDVQLRPATEVPTELTGKIEYSDALNATLIPSYSVENTLGNINGRVFSHNELGGLVNTYQTNNKTCLPKGKTVKLMPQLPEGETDSGNWLWSTGETTRDITVATDSSRIYRVVYTNTQGVKSEQMFAIAVDGDCQPSAVTPSMVYGSTTLNDTTITILYGESLTLKLDGNGGYGTYSWSNGRTTASIATGPIKNDTTFVGTFINQGGARTSVGFHIKVKNTRQDITVNGSRTEYSEQVYVNEGDRVVIGPYVPASLASTSSFQWSTGETTPQLTFASIDTTGVFTVNYTINGETGSYTYDVTTRSSLSPYPIEEGLYLIRHRDTGLYFCLPGSGMPVLKDADAVALVDSLVWRIAERGEDGSFFLQSAANDLYLSQGFSISSRKPRSAPFHVEKAAGVQYYAIFNTSGYALTVNETTGKLASAVPQTVTYPFELLPFEGVLSSVESEKLAAVERAGRCEYYTLSGVRITKPARGTYVVKQYLNNGATRTRVIYK